MERRKILPAEKVHRNSGMNQIPEHGFSTADRQYELDDARINGMMKMDLCT
jgi:hypothetical protein